MGFSLLLFFLSPFIFFFQEGPKDEAENIHADPNTKSISWIQAIRWEGGRFSTLKTLFRRSKSVKKYLNCKVEGEEEGERRRKKRIEENERNEMERKKEKDDNPNRIHSSDWSQTL